VVKRQREGDLTRVAEVTTYVQSYRSKIQFHRKFGSPRQADHFKRLLCLVQRPRLADVTLAAIFSPSLAARASVCRRLPAELPLMWPIVWHSRFAEAHLLRSMLPQVWQI
jgi:hypothetical protein